MKIVCYVLCPSEEIHTNATKEYRDASWAYPIMLPQNQPYLESYMYTHDLMRRYDEWHDADWVGCISHSAAQKQSKVTTLEAICIKAVEEQSDFIALMFRGDPLVETAETWHPGFTRAWLATWESIGWTNRSLTTSREIPSFYCNYWLTTPEIMEEYCVLMRYVDQRFRSNPRLRDLVMADSGYHHRGEQIAKLPESRRLEMFGVAWYPLYIFIMERMICPFATIFAKKLCLLK